MLRGGVVLIPQLTRGEQLMGDIRLNEGNTLQLDWIRLAEGDLQNSPVNDEKLIPETILAQERGESTPHARGLEFHGEAGYFTDETGIASELGGAVTYRYGKGSLGLRFNRVGMSEDDTIHRFDFSLHSRNHGYQVPHVFQLQAFGNLGVSYHEETGDYQIFTDGALVGMFNPVDAISLWAGVKMRMNFWGFGGEDISVGVGIVGGISLNLY